jgi:pimeloyl-ACP methyl ester carboxylesterase
MSILFRVSARTESAGGELTKAEILGSDDPTGETLLTFFVHGYNNIEWRATKRWDLHTWPGIRSLTHAPIGDFVLFFWPGDTGSLKALSALSYPSRVPVAIAAGVELGRYIKGIRRLNPGLRVQFVGHSLGCRVVLSAVEELAKQPHVVPVLRILLMAAAVPEGDCGESGRWHASIAETFAGALGPDVAESSEVVLYSKKDEILGGIFDLGERKARRDGLRSVEPYEAVGLTGGPLDRWDGGAGAKECHLKHNGYTTSKVALRHVAALFGPLTDRPMAESPLGSRLTAEVYQEERDLESAREIRLTGDR